MFPQLFPIYTQALIWFQWVSEWIGLISIFLFRILTFFSRKKVLTWVFARLLSPCQPELGSHRRLDWGRINFQAYMVVGIIQVLRCCQNESISSLLPLEWRLPSIPCYVALCMRQLITRLVGLFKANKGKILKHYNFM